jgi:thiol-disulfide isomerase/thioredoxin
MRLLPLLAVAFALLAPAAHAAPERHFIGDWDATARVGGVDIPFRLEFAGSDAAVRAVFFDGERRINPSDGGAYKDGVLTLTFESYAAVLEGRLDHGVFEGEYRTPGRAVPIRAVPHHEPASPPAPGPRIAGEWIVPLQSPKGESAWRLIVHQSGARTSAAILRIDGDTGALSGGWADGKFTLSHFAGERPALLEITPQADGTLKLVLADGGQPRELAAVRAEQAGAKPSDPKHFTSVQEASEPFRFGFPDLNGKVVSNTDARFRGKVVLVNILGSWCPNCHDEAPFLEALYARFHARGLEIVGLDFEQADQIKDLSRLRAFIRQYGVTYPVLIAGEPKELAAKVPQAVNLKAWPTTFFLGRDGRVRSVHVGFTSPASGRRDAELKAEETAEVERLLAEPAPRGR